MTSVKLSDSKRMELICEFIKTKKQPDGYRIIETSSGQYRVSLVRSEKEVLEQKKMRAQKLIESIDARLKELDKPNESIEA